MTGSVQGQVGWGFEQLDLMFLVVDKERGDFFHSAAAACYELEVNHCKEEKGNMAGSC